MNNKISIIIPIYNAERYLKHCIDSVLNQTYTNWELILVDDASTDDSTEICERYSLIDDRIKIINNNWHKGLPGLIRNIGINFSTGDFITFLDADDWLENNALEKMQHLINYGVDWVIGNFVKVKNNYCSENRKDKQILYSGFFDIYDIKEYALKALRRQNKHLIFTFCWGKLYKTDIIKKYNIIFKELRRYEDIVFNFEYLKYIKNFIYSNTIIYNYTIKENINIYINTYRFFDYIDSLKLIKSSYFFENKDIDKIFRNAIISGTIIQVIREFIKKTKYNKKIIYNFYNEIINNDEIRKSLKYYRPEKGESILIPLLIFFKLKKLLYYAIKYKAKKRYK